MDTMDNKYVYKILKIPANIEKKVARKRHFKENWTNIYHYINNKRVKNKNNVIEYDIINGSCYKSDTFYKVIYLSENDELFDYYKILKPENREPVIVKQLQRKTVKIVNHKKKPGMCVQRYRKDKPCTVDFF